VRDPVVMAHYRIDGVVTAVDAVFGMSQLNTHREAVKQVAVADRIVLTKTDLAEPQQRDALMARLMILNPAAPLISAVQGELDPAAIIDTGYAATEDAQSNVLGWLAASRYHPVTGAQALLGRGTDAVHDSAVHSFVVRFARPLDRHVVLAAVNLLCAIEGEHILRIKGVLDVAGEPHPLVLHAVQHTIYPLTHLGSRPEGHSGSALVFIVRDLDPAFVHHILVGVLGEDAIVSAAPLPAPELENLFV
jgi:G3E family GTPase